MRFVRAKVVQDEETLSYRAYVTDSLRLQGMNKIISARWIESIDPKKIDNRTGDEIALDVIRGAGLIIKAGE